MFSIYNQKDIFYNGYNGYSSMQISMNVEDDFVYMEQPATIWLTTILVIVSLGMQVITVKKVRYLHFHNW